MSRKFVKTPLYAAFFLSLASGCTSIKPSVMVECDSETTPIAQVQGNGPVSLMVDQLVTVRGVVTLSQPGSGFYLEESLSDLDPTTSDALFISDAQGFESGTELVVHGRVAELGDGRDTQTALVSIITSPGCGSQTALPQTDARLPLDDREALENMRVILEQPLTVSGVYSASQGRVLLSSSGQLVKSTEVVMPGEEAAELEARNRRYSLYAQLPDAPVVMAGSSLAAIGGVIGHNGRGLQLLVDWRESVHAPQSRPLSPPQGLRVTGLNMLNYFNGDGQGGGFPTQRGAKTPEDFQAQKQRLLSTVEKLDTHLLGVMELENDGFGPYSAARDWEAGLQSLNPDWRVVSLPDNQQSPAVIGGDDIGVGLFYRSDKVTAVGESKVLYGPWFEELSRSPLGQIFVDRATDERFLVVVNHLKSKGSCPSEGENADKRDGQGCWTPARVGAAKAMTRWIESLKSQSGVERVLILGDMNAYRMEEPIMAIKKAGYTELVEAHQSGTQYSYIYAGQAGTLDYAFASQALAEEVGGAFIWHINAAQPGNMTLSRPWLRSSDHDPVVVDIEFRQ